MILIDTSVWIDFLQARNNEKTEKLNKVLDLHIPFGITGQIYQEVLQGAGTEKDFNALKQYFDTFVLYAPLDERGSYAKAAQIFFLCRKKGITVRGTAGCLIVQIAREHRLKLLHNDKDFDHICRAIGGVEIF